MKRNTLGKIRAGLIGTALATMLLSGCQSLRDAVDVMRMPELRVDSVELEALSFSGLTLVFYVEIRNPNPIGISLAGFDYELQIEGNPFVSGQVEEKIVISARDRSTVPLPVELGTTRLIGAGSDLPLYFTSVGQVNAQFPSESSAGNTAQILARNAGLYSVPEEVAVASARPGIGGADARAPLAITALANWSVVPSTSTLSFPVKRASPRKTSTPSSSR